MADSQENQDTQKNQQQQGQKRTPKPKKEKKQETQQEKPAQTEEAITATREGDFSEWYTQVVTKAELIEYYDVSGCYVLRPWAFSLWEGVQTFFDGEIKKLGVKNAYFPCFVSEKALNAEEKHVEGFHPEVAWVTKSGDTDLKEKIALRPTSETIMYPLFSKWIRSHRDMPLKLNQWCNVVRWEFKHPVPFLRTREFLWQEGHSAFATQSEADVEVLQILELYRRVYEEVLAVPVIKGRKTEEEKFAGGLYTTTVEAFIEPNGRGIQAATSHCLGQNFAKIFNIQFENEQHAKAYAWQNSWGLTTRSVGVMVMVHGDNQGLVLPPRIAPIQIVIVNIPTKTGLEEINKKCVEVKDILTAAGFRVEVDIRDNYTPGKKFNYWERKGIPLRLEIGEKDLQKNSVFSARRDTGKKTAIPLADLVATVKSTLDDIQANLYQKAKEKRDSHLKQAQTWEEFLGFLNSKNVVLVPFCLDGVCEGNAKKRSAEESKAQQTDEKFQLTGAAKSLCIPFDQPALPEGTKCFCCGGVAQKWTIFGRSY